MRNLLPVRILKELPLKDFEVPERSLKMRSLPCKDFEGPYEYGAMILSCLV
jgi:hypothetical protein